MYKLSGFIPADLKIASVAALAPYFDDLLARPLDSVAAVEEAIKHLSEIWLVFAEQKARSYVAMTCHTDDSVLAAHYELLAAVIAPDVETATDQIQRRIAASPFFEKLPQPRYGPLQRVIRRTIELFRSENTPIQANLARLTTDYEQIAGALTAKVGGKELTLPQAAALLESTDREVRREAWMAIRTARLAVKPRLDTLFDEMLHLRHRMAVNAGYADFRDYQHDLLLRFDYTPLDVEAFHVAVEDHVLPLASAIAAQHAAKLGFEKDYRPWDVAAPLPGEEPLRPFVTERELLDKGIRVFERLRPDFAANLRAMDAAGLLDLASRRHKAPGGYNYNFEVTGMPFIFMNAAGTHDDMVTLMHEGGHAMQTFLTSDEPLLRYRDVPSETAETASMGMELLSSRYWDEFYQGADLKRAVREHRESIISFFPWCVTVDAFQHWIYQNPSHDAAARDVAFDRIYAGNTPAIIRWDGLEDFRIKEWQRQLHIFTLPFYYIEYGIAQLGALQVYRGFLKNPQAGLDRYIRGLSLGASRSLPEVWREMGIRFDFSAAMVQEMMALIKSELTDIQ